MGGGDLGCGRLGQGERRRGGRGLRCEGGRLGQGERRLLLLRLLLGWKRLEE